MHFNIKKRKALGIGRGNPHNKYSISNKRLVGSGYEKYLGVIVSLDLSLRKRCIETINKYNRHDESLIEVIKVLIEVLK